MASTGSGENTSKKDEIVLLSRPSKGTTARASSVLQRNVKTYGPMNALDTEDGSSCWYSDGEEGSTQSLTIHFGRQVLPTQIRIQFQAGFAAESCQVHRRKDGGWDLLEEIEPSDTHEAQSFDLENTSAATDAIKVVFDEFTDFYGRVTIYQLAVWGSEVAEKAK